MKRIKVLGSVLKRTRADKIIIAVTFIGKMCSVLLTIYSLFVVAIATGVVVNFYTQMVELQRKETLAMFMDQLERLPELSREELENISRKVRQFR